MWLSSYLRYATLTAPGIYYKQNSDSKELSHFWSCTTCSLRSTRVSCATKLPSYGSYLDAAFADLVAVTVGMGLQGDDITTRFITLMKKLQVCRHWFVFVGGTVKRSTSSGG